MSHRDELPPPHEILPLPAGYRIQPVRGAFGAIDGYTLAYQPTPGQLQYVQLPGPADELRALAVALIDLADQMAR